MSPYRKPAIVPPWKGWDDSSPSLMLEPSSFKKIVNFLIQKNRLYSGPTFNNFVVPPTGAGVTLWGLRSFLDATSTYHTVAFSSVQPYYLRTDGTYDTIPNTGRPWPQVQNNPYALEVYQNQLFFSGGLQTLSYIVGDNDYYTAGDAPGGCLFLGKLDGKLLMLNTYENQLFFPRRVRWSALNNALEWDGTVDFTAGVTDISEVEDVINGFSTIGSNGFIYRLAGISVMTPTGIGLNPFRIENLCNGPAGVGVWTPFTLANWGTFSIFRSEDDIYLFDAANPVPIGGKAKKSILADIDNASSLCNSVIIARIAKGVDYLSYWLTCPANNDTSTNVWVYYLNGQCWQKFELPYGAIRIIQNLVTS